MESSTTSEWWQTFFHGPWLEFQKGYDGLGEENKQTARALASLLELSPGSTILDVPCGTGRIGIELAALGHEVTGLDINEALLEEARKNADARGLPVRWMPGDMRQPPVEGGFDAVICYWGSFGVFNEEDNLHHARAMHRALRPGGRFLLELASLEVLAVHPQPRDWVRSGKITALEESSYDPFTGRVHTRWTFYDQDKRLGEYETDMRIYSTFELVELLRRAGFSEFAAYSDLEGSRYSLGSRQLILVATR